MEKIIDAMAEAIRQRDYEFMTGQKSEFSLKECTEFEQEQYRNLARVAYEAGQLARRRMTAMERAQEAWQDWRELEQRQEMDP